MANEYLVNQTDLVSVANAIRAKGGTSGELNFPTGFVSAIEAIVAGGGSSGGTMSGLAYDMGEFSVSTDVNTNNFGAKNGLDPMPDGIPHNLGEAPDFICVWTDEWAGITEAPYTSGTTMVGFVWMNGMTGMTGRASNTANYPNPLLYSFSINANDYRVGGGAPSSVAYGITNARLPDANAFRTPTFGTGTWWRAGVTYKYFVSKAWWTVGGGSNA